jgi:two-component system OmpR family sensor kinase
MGRLFWKLFIVIWLSIASLICALIFLTNFFGLLPPPAEIQRSRLAFVLTVAGNMIAAGNLEDLDGFAAGALKADPPIGILVDKLADVEACRQTSGQSKLTRLIEKDGRCYRIDISDLNRGRKDFLYLSIPFIAASLASFLASIWLASYMAGPIVTLKQGLSALAHGDFEFRIGDRFGRRHDEISDLGLDFDATASKLEALQVNQQRLYHDVSHELRSPLTRLQAALGVLRQNPAKLEPMLPRMNREIERMDALVEEILTLAKLSSGSIASFERQRIDVIDLLHAILDDAAFEATARSVELTVEGSPQDFLGDLNGELIYRAMENVVRNAIKYTSENTTVSIEMSLSAREMEQILCICVRDRGPGVADDQLQTIFEPFVRAVDNGEATGHGLGLAIARQSLQFHGGKIWAENRLDGGLAVFMEIPGRAAAIAH